MEGTTTSRRHILPSFDAFYSQVISNPQSTYYACILLCICAFLLLCNDLLWAAGVAAVDTPGMLVSSRYYILIKYIVVTIVLVSVLVYVKSDHYLNQASSVSTSSKCTCYTVLLPIGMLCFIFMIEAIILKQNVRYIYVYTCS